MAGRICWTRRCSYVIADRTRTGVLADLTSWLEQSSGAEQFVDAVGLLEKRHPQGRLRRSRRAAPKKAVRTGTWSVELQQPGWRGRPGMEPCLQSEAMFLTIIDSDGRPCRVKTALDLHRAGREPSFRSPTCCAPCSSPRSSVWVFPQVRALIVASWSAKGQQKAGTVSGSLTCGPRQALLCRPAPVRKA